MSGLSFIEPAQTALPFRKHQINWPGAMAPRRFITEEEGARIVGLKRAGYSASQIGEIVGRSKGSIISAWRRLGISKPEPKRNRSRNPGKPRQPREKAPANRMQLALHLIERRHGAIKLRVTSERATCRWPFGDPKNADFRFCDSPDVLPGLPYCLCHALAAYVPTDRQENAL